MSDNRKQENAALIKSLSTLLHAEPDGESYDHGGSLKFDNGASVFIRLPYYRMNSRDKKGTASGSFPRSADGSCMSAKAWGLIPYGQDSQCDIGFSIEKTPEQIAKDITKRLLPVYLPLYEKALTKLKADQESKARNEKAMAKILKCAGIAHGSCQGSQEFSGYLWDDEKTKSEIYLKGRMSGERASLCFEYLEIEEALEVIKLVKSFEIGRRKNAKK
jgi:hypothetical protein